MDHTDNLRLVEIEQRMRAATPGPWSAQHITQRGQWWGAEIRASDTPGDYICISDEGEGCVRTSRADADFIANARMDIEFLLEWIYDRLGDAS